jgi:hypothetical protein
MPRQVWWELAGLNLLEIDIERGSMLHQASSLGWKPTQMFDLRPAWGTIVCIETMARLHPSHPTPVLCDWLSSSGSSASHGSHRIFSFLINIQCTIAGIIAPSAAGSDTLSAPASKHTRAFLQALARDLRA